MDSEPMLTPREKSSLTKQKSPQRKIEPTTLHQAGQRAQHTTNELFQPQLLYDLIVPASYIFVYSFFQLILIDIFKKHFSSLWDHGQSVEGCQFLQG